MRGGKTACCASILLGRARQRLRPSRSRHPTLIELCPILCNYRWEGWMFVETAYVQMAL